jgi:antitoxin (DNA-binding transcriptional repressor) of toxin-antitoxin stability system
LICMRAVGLKVLKNKLSEYVRLAEQGETVLVTEGDRVIAELSPPQKSRSPMISDALLAEAVQQGWIMRPTMPSGGPPLRKPVMSLRDLIRELEQDRSDR